MSTPIHAMLEGTFTVPATPVNVPISLPPGFTHIRIFNDTGIAAGGAGINILEKKDSFAGSACILYTGAALVPSIVAAAGPGIYFVADSADQSTGPLIVNAASGITNVPQPVVTSGTLYPVGSVIRLSNTTAALQLSGMDYEVTVSGAGTMTLGMVATAPGSAATANDLRQVNPSSRYYPKSRYITGITLGATTIVAMSVTHGFTVGQTVRLILPQFWGTTQLNGLLGNIIAVGAAIGGVTNTITLDINSTGFTAFTYPTSAQAALGVGFPQVVPVGEDAVGFIGAIPVANLLDDATRNISFTGVVIEAAGGNLIAANSYSWIAQRSQAI